MGWYFNIVCCVILDQALRSSPMLVSLISCSKVIYSHSLHPPFSCFTVSFDHFEILRAIGKGSFGKVRAELSNSLWSCGSRMVRECCDCRGAGMIKTENSGKFRTFTNLSPLPDESQLHNEPCAGSGLPCSSQLCLVQPPVRIFCLPTDS